MEQKPITSPRKKGNQPPLVESVAFREASREGTALVVGKSEKASQGGGGGAQRPSRGDPAREQTSSLRGRQTGASRTPRSPATAPAPRLPLRVPQLHFAFPLTAPCDQADMLRGPLRPGGFELWLSNHPDIAYKNTLIDIIRFGAKVGYTGPPQHIISPNALSTLKDPESLTKDIQKRADLNQLQEIPAKKLPKNFISSPLKLAPKSDGTWRRIHNLSLPPGKSVNDHIPQPWAVLKYIHFDDAVNAIRYAGPGATLVKRDLADAYRHIPVHPDDWWLLGFQWQERYWCDQYLPFGLRTAPIIFDQFSSALEWILRHEKGWEKTLHYLDDFLCVIPSHRKVATFVRDFDRICTDLGFKINQKKNQHGTRVTFLGIEVDTLKMEARLPPGKREKIRTGLKAILREPKVHLAELEALVGRLAYAACIIPDSRAFLQRLYEIQNAAILNRGKPVVITGDAKEDLIWWESFMKTWPGISLLAVPTKRSRIWIHATSGEGIGGYFLREEQLDTNCYSDRSQMFSERIPESGRKEGIVYAKLSAVLHALRTWQSEVRGLKVVVHCDNATITDALRKYNIAGPALSLIRSIAKIAVINNITLEVVCIPTDENALADALSRSDDARVAKICPRLLGNLGKKTGKDSGKAATTPPKVTATKPTSKNSAKEPSKEPPKSPQRTAMNDTPKVKPKDTEKPAWHKPPQDTSTEKTKKAASVETTRRQRARPVSKDTEKPVWTKKSTDSPTTDRTSIPAEATAESTLEELAMVMSRYMEVASTTETLKGPPATTDTEVTRRRRKEKDTAKDQPHDVATTKTSPKPTAEIAPGEPRDASRPHWRKPKATSIDMPQDATKTKASSKPTTEAAPKEPMDTLQSTSTVEETETPRRRKKSQDMEKKGAAAPTDEASGPPPKATVEITPKQRGKGASRAAAKVTEAAHEDIEKPLWKRKPKDTAVDPPTAPTNAVSNNPRNGTPPTQEKDAAQDPSTARAPERPTWKRKPKPKTGEIQLAANSSPPQI